MVGVGDTLPSAKVFTAVFPDTELIDIADYCKDKSVIIVGLPGVSSNSEYIYYICNNLSND